MEHLNIYCMEIISKCFLKFINFVTNSFSIIGVLYLVTNETTVLVKSMRDIWDSEEYREKVNINCEQNFLHIPSCHWALYHYIISVYIINYIILNTVSRQISFTSDWVKSTGPKVPTDTSITAGKVMSTQAMQECYSWCRWAQKAI